MLRIEPVRHLRDDGSYECLAENGVGDPVTASANLTVFAGKNPKTTKYLCLCTSWNSTKSEWMNVIDLIIIIII